MNTQQQVATVKAIIKIKNKILHSSDWDDIAGMVQQAVDISASVPANEHLNPLDRTKSKEWNIISVKKLIVQIKDRNFSSLETAYPEIATSLLRLSMVFVKGGLEDVNKILAESLLNNGMFQTGRAGLLSKRS